MTPVNHVTRFLFSCEFYGEYSFLVIFAMFATIFELKKKNLNIWVYGYVLISIVELFNGQRTIRVGRN